MGNRHTKALVRQVPPACRERRGGDAAPDTKEEEAVDGGSEPNKRPPMREWEVVAPS
jgi:hypothetical protein